MYFLITISFNQINSVPVTYTPVTLVREARFDMLSRNNTKSYEILFGIYSAGRNHIVLKLIYEIRFFITYCAMTCDIIESINVKIYTVFCIK